MTMRRYVLSLVALLMVTSLFAEPQAPQTLRVIPKTYISPGGSGRNGLNFPAPTLALLRHR